MRTDFFSLPHADVIQHPTKDAFFEGYGFASKPVVIQGLMDDWEATTKWNPRFFAKHYGDLLVTPQRTYTEGAYRTFTVAEYMDYLVNTRDEDPYYLRNWEFHLEHTEIKEDYLVPDYFESWHVYIPEPHRPRLSWFYIGPAQSGSAMHLDPTDTSAWNAVVSGKKYWLFFPPEQSDYVYEGLVDAFNPNLDKFPYFAKTQPVAVVQNPGEVVFTPSGWWHQVLNVEPCISITENFINETNIDNVKKHLEKKNMVEELRLLNQLAASIL